jgi:hypothetical protein|mmetsp:Transcript_88416/g.146914  ORF Transcript_88416/g.146914 Transcript_88416/m.146914 type:complete len:98 (-) Transcript_88416:159-452(-)
MHHSANKPDSELPTVCCQLQVNSNTHARRDHNFTHASAHARTHLCGTFDQSVNDDDDECDEVDKRDGVMMLMLRMQLQQLLMTVRMQPPHPSKSTSK